MAFCKSLLLACIVAVSSAQQRPQLRLVPNSRFDLDFNLVNERENTTPVPILRYIDTQNPDGSYTYGYESGDGTYKLETRYATGEVKGKYGYLDSNGQLREVEYGATPERGFEPRAEGLILPPPTLDYDYEEPVLDTPAVEEEPVVVEEVEEVPAPRRKFSNFEDSGATSRRVVVRKKDRRTRLPIRGETRRPAATRPLPAPAQPRTIARPAATRPRPAATRPRPAPVQQAAPAVPQQRFAPASPFVAPSAATHAGFNGHPANNIDLNTGTYTVFYSGR